MGNYYWIRVFDYVYERDSKWQSEINDKGVLLDEFYLKDVVGGREEVKRILKERYIGDTSTKIAFAKPRGKNGY